MDTYVGHSDPIPQSRQPHPKRVEMHGKGEAESTFEIVRKTLLKTTRLDYAPPEFQGCILERSSRESPAKRNFISISARLNKARFNRCRSLNNTFQFPKDINPFSIAGRGGTGRADK